MCRKLRHGDTAVEVMLPLLAFRGRAVVLVDDVASSGHTLAQAALRLREAGAASVDVAVTHALFAHDAGRLLWDAGIREVWSTDCISHPSNAVNMAPALAAALQ